MWCASGARPVRRAALSVTLERGSDVRKSTGTFYTPEPLARYLVRRTLGPLVKGRTAEQILELRVLDPATGSGAFLVAACRFLAHAYADALVEHGECRAGDLGPHDETALPANHRGAMPVRRRPQPHGRSAGQALALAHDARGRSSADVPRSSPAGRRQPARRVAAVSAAPTGGAGAHERDAAALRRPGDWDTRCARRCPSASRSRRSRTTPSSRCGRRNRRSRRSLGGAPRSRPGSASPTSGARSWFTRNPPPASAFGALSDAILTGTGALPDRTALEHLEAAETAAAAVRFFHWELEFPEVFFNADGTERDAAPGSTRSSATRRGRCCAAIADSERAASAGQDPPRAKRPIHTAVGALRRSVRWSRQPLSAVRRTRRGAHSTRRAHRPGAALRPRDRPRQREAPAPAARRLRCRRHRGLRQPARRVSDSPQRALPARHRHERATHNSGGLSARRTGPGGPRGGRRCLRAQPSPSRPALLLRISGTDLALPDLRSPLDLAIVERCASLFPALGEARGWGARFGRELNVSDDREAFGSPRRGLPVVEGKHIDPFAVRLADTRWSIALARGRTSPRHPARAPTARLSRRGGRVQPPHADRGHPSGRLRLDAHGLLPQDAAADRRTAFSLRPLQQLRPELPGEAPRQHARHDRGRGAAARADAGHGARRRSRRSSALPDSLFVAGSRRSCTAERVRRQRCIDCRATSTRHILDTFPLVPREERDVASGAFEQRG